jgi:serine/threonine-protein kinase
MLGSAMAAGFKAGEIIDRRYQLVTELGRGSAATVYGARDLERGREVAIKVMRSRLAGSAEARARFLREAAIQKQIEHRNVAALWDEGLLGDQPYLVVELLRGRSLRHVARREAPIEPLRAASYAYQALIGLAAIHAAGVVHRDIKPANLMLEPSPGPIERVVLIDFGFASLSGDVRLTAAGHVVGSLGYLAPERLLGEAAVPASDLYSVGILLFELLAGRRPFLADDDLALCDLHIDAEVPAIAAVAPVSTSVPVALEEVVRIALAKRPVDRFHSAGAMAAALGAAIQD